MIIRSCFRACRRFLIGLAGDMGAAAVPAQCPSCLRRLEVRGRLCRRCCRRLRNELGGGCLMWRMTEPGAIPGRSVRVSAVGQLAGVWGRLIRAYKEDPDPQTAALLEPIWSGFVSARMSRDAGVGSVLVPVPMAPVRRRQRGFNPPEGLAMIAARITGRPVLSRALRRVRYMGPLRGKGARQRRDEMKDAFAPGPDAARISGARVVLVDDVATTGATLCAAAAALRGMGAGSGIRVWVLGRTPRPGVRGRRAQKGFSGGDGERDPACGGGTGGAAEGSPQEHEAGSVPGVLERRAAGRAQRGREPERCFVKS